MGKKCKFCNHEMPQEASFCMHCFSRTNTPKTVEIKQNSKNKKIFLSTVISVILVAIAVSTITVFALKNDSPAVDEQTTTTAVANTTKAQTTKQTTVTEKKTTITRTTEKQTTEKLTEEEKEKTTSKPTEKTTTSPSGSFGCASYGNGVRITSYSGNETDIKIPDKIDGKTVLAVSENAFSNNSYIKSITFEEGSKSKSLSLSPKAFNKLSSLKSLKLPSVVEAEELSKCICACSSLESVTISEKFPQGSYYSTNGIVFKDNADSTVTLVYYPPARRAGTYTIAYKVSGISNNAFNGNPYLTSIKFSKRESLDVSWKNLFSSGNLPNLEEIQIYVGTDVDLVGMQYFNGEILYYD